MSLSRLRPAIFCSTSLRNRLFSSIGNKLLPRHRAGSNRRPSLAPCIRDQIERGNEWAKFAVELGVSNLLIFHVFDAHAGSREKLVIKIIAGAPPGNVSIRSQGENDVQHSIATKAFNMKI